MSAAVDIGAEASWLERFVADPAGEVSAVLGGYARVFPLERLEPGTILIESFSDLPGDDPRRGQLDAVVLDLLNRFRRATPKQVERHGKARLIHHVDELFLTAGQLRLPGVLKAVGDDFAGWTDWARRMRLSDSHDARLDLWRMVAGNQDLAGLGRSLAAHWLNICGEVGAARVSAAYLPIALDGLLDLPPREGCVDSVDDVLFGLVRWSRALRATPEDEDEFLVVWAGLSGRLGLTPTDLQYRVSDVLERSASTDAPFVGWWTAALDMERPTKRKTARGPGTDWKAVAETLLGRIRSARNLSRELRDEVIRFVAESEAFADAAGDSYGHSRAMNRLGGALLRFDPRLTLRLVASALERDPFDAHQYGLWARALMELGKGEAAVGVLWRGIAVDPNRVENYTILAEALHRLGRVGEAEALYRETIRLFPDNDVSRTALAKLLADHGRDEEALTLYRETIRLFPNDDVSRNALAKLLADHGRDEEALTLYRETVARFSRDPVCRLDLGLLLLRMGPDEAALTEVRGLSDQLRRMGATQANTLAHHLDRHSRGEPFRTGGRDRDEVLEPLVPGELPDDLMVEARAREARFRLGRALDDPKLLLLTTEERDRLRREAVFTLNRLLKNDPGNPTLALLARRYRGEAPDLLPIDDEDIRLGADSDPTLAVAARRFGLLERDYDTVRNTWPDHAALADWAEVLDLGTGATRAAARLSDRIKSFDERRARAWDTRLTVELTRLLLSRGCSVDGASLLELENANPDGLDELLEICLMAAVETTVSERTVLALAA